MEKQRPEFNEAALQKQYDENLESAKTGKVNTYGIFKDLPDWPFFKFEAGKQYQVRFIPWLANGDEKRPVWYLEVAVHKFVGPKNNAKDYVCLTHLNKPCVLCNELEKKSSSRYFYLLAVRDGEKFNPAIVEVNSLFHEALCKSSESIDMVSGKQVTNYFMSPTKGNYVGFITDEVIKSTYKWLEPRSVGFSKECPMLDEFYGHTMDLHAHLRFFNGDQLQNAIYGQHPDNDVDPATIISGVAPASGVAIPQIDVPGIPPINQVPVAPVIEQPIAQQAPQVLRELPVETPSDAMYEEIPVVETVKETMTIAEPILQGQANVVGVQMCSKGLAFGDPKFSAKQNVCKTCPEEEYKLCVQTASNVK